MAPRVGIPWILARIAAAALIVAGVSACGKGGAVTGANASATPGQSCQATVLDTLGKVVKRVYREGVHSERTIVATQLITRSVALREALEHNDPAAARAAARALVARGKIADLIVTSLRGLTLADVGGAALAPFSGSISGVRGQRIGSYVASVWSDNGFLTESSGIAEGALTLRVGTHNLPGSSDLLPAQQLPRQGAITIAGRPYQYYSLGGQVFPGGAGVRIYLTRSAASTAQYCAAGAAGTTVNTLAHVAELIYAGEAGPRTLTQIHRVQHYRPLLEAVARREPAASEAAIKKLLHQHIVRMRVYAGPSPGQGAVAGAGASAGAGAAAGTPQPLADVGGPYVLAPVSAPLRLQGRTVGTLVLSIQDDEGYLRLARRLAGLRVLMFMGTRLVKNSLGPNPGHVPETGRYEYGNRSWRVFTLHATAFPSGPLTIRVLTPIPYP